RAIATDRDERVDPEVVKAADDLVGSIGDAPGTVRPTDIEAEWVASRRGAQDRAAQVRDPANRVRGEREDAWLTVDLTLEQARVSATDPEYFPPFLERGESGRADHGIQPRSVPATRIDRDSSN